ncbi:MAG: hypothetical protein NVS3B12_06980 [Acidimicrobiales bacterium]
MNELGPDRERSGLPVEGVVDEIPDAALASANVELPYRRILETANQGVWILDPQGTTIFANDKTSAMLGFTREQMSEVSLFDVLDDDGKAQAAANLERRRQGGSAQLECAFQRRDGSRVWVLLNASPLHDEDGDYLGSVCMMSEISDRKAIEEALLAREQQLAEAQRVGHLGSWEWDIIADRLSWSDELYRIFGLRPEELVPSYQGYVDHVHPDDRALLNERVGAALESGESFEIVNRFVGSGGQVGWIHGRGEVIRDEAGTPLVMRGTALDVSAAKAVEAELARARDAAMESSRLKSEFLATMSHEIRTPMNGVIGLTGLLLTTELDERQRQYAEGVQRAGDALLAIINDILDFSKIEAGKLELEVVDFDLVEVIEEVAAMIAEPAQRKGLELIAYCFPGVPTAVRGDPARLRQILLNLVSNAVKFTDRGEIALRARLATEFDRRPAHGTTVDEIAVRFDIVDTGIGIAEEDRQRLFEPFSQADASTTRRFGGTGLGLAISRRLVTAMGGSIGVESQAGRGSTFWLTLPLAPANGLSGDASVKPPFHHLLHGTSVLIVDDNETNRLILSRQLQAWDMRTQVATDGASALDHLRQAAAGGHHFDLALLDMCMPEMDGLELARRISADPDLAKTKLVLLTSAVDVGAEESRQAGIATRLTKPVRLSQLFDTLMGITAPSTAADQEAVPAPAFMGAGSRGHVLVVEDNAINQMVAVGILEQLGYSSEVVGDGIEALEALERAPFAAVLMDCQMPDLDGYNATLEIRRREGESHHTPIIAMTAGAVEGDRERCLAAGMDDYIAKPVKPAEVDAALARWVSAATAHAPSAVDGPVEVDPPVLDPRRLEMLRGIGSGDGSLLATMIDTFVAEAPAYLGAVTEGVTDADPIRLRHAAHRLLGAAANLGAAHTAMLCVQLEQLGIQESLDGAPAVLAKLTTEIGRTIIAMRAMDARPS